MDLKILFLIVGYWTIFLLLVSFGGSTILTNEGLSVSADMNSTALSINETDRGGLFNTGVSFGRFFGFVLFGLGLPNTYPSWFRLIIGFWQTAWTIFTVGFIFSSIWDG